jgi:phospholipase C
MKSSDLCRYVLGGFTVAAMLAGCGGAQPSIGAPSATTQSAEGALHAQHRVSWVTPEGGVDKIKHIVVVIQQNRSFNDLFLGYPGAMTQSYGYNTRGRKVELQPASLASTWSLTPNFLAACNGTGKIPGTDCRMDGFNEERGGCGPPRPNCPKYPAYSYVPRDETGPYWSMAEQYVLADQMYASNFDAGMFESLQYIIAAQDHDTIGSPETNWGCPGGPADRIATINRGRMPGKLIRACFHYTTLGDELDVAGLTWAYYANPIGSSGPWKTCGNADQTRPNAYRETGIWSAYQAIKHICYGPDWDKDIISPPKQFLTDVSEGKLRAVSWVTSTGKNSDLAGSDSKTGPSWVAAVVNAVGESRYWDSAAIFIFWTGYGGWFDPAPPAYFNRDSLGLRVPLLIVSPYAKKGYVSHVHYEHGSILRFIEDRFGLAQMAASDERATSPAADSFDFSQEPRKFVPIKTH